MIRPMIALILFSVLAACSTQEKHSLSAKEQVAGITKMCDENASAIKKRQEEQSLYSRLGGKEGIEEFSSRLYESHKSNEKIGHLFAHVSEQPFISNVTNFLVTHSGGGGEYSGRTMEQVHNNLGITHEDFLAAGGDVQAVMKELGAGENEVQEAVCFLASFVPVVVTR